MWNNLKVMKHQVLQHLLMSLHRHQRLHLGLPQYVLLHRERDSETALTKYVLTHVRTFQTYNSNFGSFVTNVPRRSFRKLWKGWRLQFLKWTHWEYGPSSVQFAPNPFVNNYSTFHHSLSIQSYPFTQTLCSSWFTFSSVHITPLLDQTLSLELQKQVDRAVAVNKMLKLTHDT